MLPVAFAFGVTSIAVGAALAPLPYASQVAPRVKTAAVFKKVVALLQAKTDYSGLAEQIHTKGVSVYYSPTSPEVTFSVNELRKLAFDERTKNFGTSPGSGTPIEVTGELFFFNLRHDTAPKGVGPLPDWSKITASANTKAYGKAQVTSWEGAAHIPAKFKGKPFWSVGYQGTSEVDRFDSGEVRVVFDVDKAATGSNKYRVVALVLAATYSP
jgi:hypothetical protein